MKNFLPFKNFFGIFLGAVLLTTGCSVSTSVPPFNGGPTPPPGWPSFKSTPASGQVFGADWKIVTAVAKAMPSVENSNKKAIVIQFFAEEMDDVCNTTIISQKPKASVILPNPLSIQEYLTDTNEGTGSSPLIFTSTSGGMPINVIAEKTRISIQDISPGKITAQVYAMGRNEDDTINEVNGLANIVDCSTLPQPKVAQNSFRNFGYEWQGDSGITSPGRDASLVFSFTDLAQRSDGYEFQGRGSCSYISNDGYGSARYMFSYGVGERHFMANNGSIYLLCRGEKTLVGKATDSSFEIEMGECQDFSRPRYEKLKVKMVNSNQIYIHQSGTHPQYSYTCSGNLEKSN